MFVFCDKHQVNKGIENQHLLDSNCSLQRKKVYLFPANATQIKGVKLLYKYSLE